MDPEVTEYTVCPLVQATRQEVSRNACTGAMRPTLEEPCQELQTPIAGIVGAVRQSWCESGILMLATDTPLLVEIQDSPVRPEQYVDKGDNLFPGQPPNPL